MQCCPICTADWPPPQQQQRTSSPQACGVCGAIVCPKCSFVNRRVPPSTADHQQPVVCRMCETPLRFAGGASPPASAPAGIPPPNQYPAAAAARQQPPAAVTRFADNGPGNGHVLQGRVRGDPTSTRGAASSSPAADTAMDAHVGAARQDTIASMEATVESVRQQCRASGSPFVDVSDIAQLGGGGDAELRQYPMTSVLLPRDSRITRPPTGMALMPTKPMMAMSPTASGGDGENVAQAFFRFLSGVASGVSAAVTAADHWELFDARIGVHPSEILQGALGDCWFLSAVAVLAHRHPQLIEDLFVVKRINPEGVFGVRLWHDGQWRCYVVSAAFPSAHGGRQLAFARNRSGGALWVSVLEKAFARSRGGYHMIRGGRPRDALFALTGMPCLSFALKLQSQQQRRRQRDDDDDLTVGGGDNDDVSPEEMFSRLASFVDAHCILVACCGGTAMSDAAADQLGLETNHAYSILAMTTHPMRPAQRVVALRNPWGRSKYRGMRDPPAGSLRHHHDRRRPGQQTPPRSGTSEVVNGGDDDHDLHAGAIFWMDYFEFMMCFTEVDVCLTRKYQTVLSVVPGLRIPERGNTAHRWDAFTPPEADVRRRLLFTVLETCEVHIMVAQAGPPPSSSSSRDRETPKFRDMTVIILSLIGATGAWEVHSASNCACEHIALHSALLNPGVHIVLPLSLSGIPPEHALHVSILSESPHVALLADENGEGGPPLPRLSQLLYKCARYALGNATAGRGGKSKRLCGDVNSITVNIGQLYMIVLEHVDPNLAAGGVALRGGRRETSVAEVLVDCSGSEGLVVCTDSALSGTTRVQLHQGCAVVAALAAPLPHGGTFLTMFRHQTEVKVHTTVGGGGLSWLMGAVMGTSGSPTGVEAASSAAGIFAPFPIPHTASQ